MYRGFIKEITNLAGQPIGNADLRVRNISIRRDILTSASSEFEVLGIPEQAKEGNVFGCYDEYGKIIYLGVITNIDDNTIQTNQIIALFNDKWLWNDPKLATIEQTVQSILTTDFKNNADSLMRTIFSQFDITIDSSGTALELPTQKENYVMNFMEFIFQLYENYQILLDIDIKYNAVRPTITILKPSYPTLKLSNNNNSLQNFNIMKETYETNKLVLYGRDGTLRGTWYGTENGITTDASAARLPKIKTNIVFSDDPAEDIIADNLSNQMYNHKIELDLVLNNKLYNFDDFKLGQSCQIYYQGNVYDSVLTGYEIKINENGTSDVVNLVFGIVRVSLVDKLNRLIVDADSDTAVYSTQAKEDGDGNVITETYETKADANSKYVKKTGDTMTGLLEVDDSIRSTNNMLVKAVGANARFRAQDTTHSGEIRLTWGNNHQTHGLLSTGYSTDGATLTSNNMWLIYRTSDNKVRLSGGKATVDTSGNFRAEGYGSFGGKLYVDGGQVISGTLTKEAKSYVEVRTIAGEIYLESGESATATKALRTMNHAGTYKTIIDIDQNNVATFYGHTTRSVGWFKHNRSASIAVNGTDMPPKVLIKQVGSDFSIVSGNIHCARAGTIRVTAKIFAWHNSTNGGAMTCWIRVNGTNDANTQTTLSWFTNGVLYIEGIFDITASTNLSVQIKNVSTSGNLSVQATSTYIVEYLD